MDAELARQITKENQKNNEEMQKNIKYTEHNIKEAAKKGGRHAVMVHPYWLETELRKYWNEKGFEVKRLFPPQETLYVVW
ncbi:MAG: hypothetical protein IKF82_00320 [Bacilli bacterium]|nr:hypothetical protein [Bacilli bacterium]